MRRRETSSTVRSLVWLAAGCLFCAVAAAQTSSSPKAGSQSASAGQAPPSDLKGAVERLIAEAKELDDLESPKFPPVFQRPHAAVAGLGAEQATAVLDRMADPFTGNEYRDTYIRWHLVETLKKADAGALRRESQRIIRLINQMPGPLQLPLLQEWKDDPMEISQKWHALAAQTRVVVGYPPFERIYWGEAALPYMDPQRRATMPPILKEMERLKPLWKRSYDQKAMTRNDRVRRVNWVVRQYRGELIYVLLMSGDASVLPRCIGAVQKSVKAKDRAAFDILSFMYLAAFDGVLSQYPAEALRQAGQSLEAIARSAEGYELYKDGQYDQPAWAPQRIRNFTDYAFHLAHMLQEGPAQYVGSGQRISRIAPPPDIIYAAAPLSAEAQLKNAARPPIKPEELGIETIREATRMAIEALHRLEPNYTFPDEHLLYRVWNSGRYGADPLWQQTIHEMGNHALACWAMLAAGESSQDPRIRLRLNWVMASDAPYAYDRGMRAEMMTHMPPDRWAPWVRRDALWFAGALNPAGNFGYEWTGKPAEGAGDNANGQYGVLGMSSVQEAKYSVPDKSWKAVDEYWRNAQNTETGGWSALGVEKKAPAPGALQKNTAAFAGLQKTQTSGPMTAGGVMVLSQTDRFLYGEDYKVLGKAKPLPHLQHGLEWLDKNFSLDDKSEAADFFYYMWTIQSVGHASGYRTFNKVDWYRNVTARLLSLQQKDGTWEDSKGKLLSTGFALLYLARANAPVAIAKVRFNGHWNNRPHDLLNFVEWASDEYETPQFWQIIDPDLPLHELIEPRMLYLASNEAVDLSQAQVDGLRRYIQAGGLLVLVPEGPPGAFNKSTDKLATDLFGGSAKFEDIPADHWITQLHRPLSAKIKMSAVHNGVRPLIVRFQKDIAQDLQANDLTQLDTFYALSNLYLYVTGKEFARPRLDTNYIPLKNTKPGRKIAVARIRHTGAYDPEPYAWTRLTALLANQHDVELKVDAVEPAGLTSDHRIAFLAATGDAKLDPTGAQALRKWVEGGGTLWVDAVGGQLEAAHNAEQLLKDILPDSRRVPLQQGHPIISGQGLKNGYDNKKVGYRRLLLLRYGQVDRSRLFQVDVGGRPGIIFSSEDLTAGLAGLRHWGIYGYTPESATQLVINGILSAQQPPVPKAGPTTSAAAATTPTAAPAASNPPSPTASAPAASATAPPAPATVTDVKK